MKMYNVHGLTVPDLNNKYEYLSIKKMWNWKK